ncbi:MAG: hypothetical protein M1838_005355, partial [Thelocarpon superellum]
PDFAHLHAPTTHPVPGEGGYCCCYDSLAAAGDVASQTAENVLLVGRDSGLDVFRVEASKLSLLGRLNHLRGGVHGAKILPWTARDDPLAEIRPLVAVVVHGPLASDAGAPAPSPPPPPVNHEMALVDLHQRPPYPNGPSFDETTHYQTSVEIYSLRRGSHIATLYTSPPVELPTPTSSPFFVPPPPVGSLRLEACGRYVVVASGTSGELFVFGLLGTDAEQGRKGTDIRCLAKVWSTIQPSVRASAPSSANSSDSEGPGWEGRHDDVPQGTPLVSLSHRWLAYVPAPRSTPSLNGRAGVAEGHPTPVGLSTHTAPSQPAVTCAVDMPDPGGILNRVTREVTQEVIKGAKWVGDQGLQAWRNYWHKQSGNESAGGPSGPMARDANPFNLQYFPPTHGQSTAHLTPSNDPSLVSIIDLDRLVSLLGTSSPARLSPIATFPAPLGCSFLSFAPDGLALLTASKKGDVQFVWDLMRIQHGKVGPGLASSTMVHGPKVRQLARFSRMTVAKIVDVVWTRPQGRRLAIITSRGTVHLFSLPPSAYQWPPPRRMVRPGSVTGGGKTEATAEKPMARNEAVGNAVSAAIKMVTDTTQPILTAAQRRRGSTGPGFGALTSTGMQGGKMMAAGLSKSLGAASGTISTFRNVGDNRISLPTNGGAVAPDSVRWMTGRERGLIGVIGGGTLRVIRLGGGRSGQRGRRFSSTDGKVVEYEVNFSDERVTSSLFGRLADDERVDGSAETSMTWKPCVTEGPRRDVHLDSHPLSYAEIETNAPYQPFHTDPRVRLFAYTGSDTGPSLSTSTEPWTFGNEIATRKLNVGATTTNESSADEELLCGQTMENVLQIGKDADSVEQIVVTTQRRKRGHRGNGEVGGGAGLGLGGDDGFFEDDCDVLDFAEDRV